VRAQALTGVPGWSWFFVLASRNITAKKNPFEPAAEGIFDWFRPKTAALSGGR
jgi:hypothetical protein